MAKKYYVQRNGSWHTWEFLRLRQNDPKWREAYLAAKRQRLKDAMIATVVGVLVLALTATGIYFVVEIYGNNQEEIERSLSITSSSSINKENNAVNSSIESSSSEAPRKEPLTLNWAEERVTQLFQARAQNDPEWAFLNKSPYGPLAYYNEDGKIAVEVRQASEDNSHDSWIANFKEDENGELIEVNNIYTMESLYQE
ncbi:hypothetical protein [Enterococcus sp. AZ163]|uniref:hypothetical protein n=1 Tax=Enterococcus sp. AZ163 TaxID=2774638 RepID=UPI003D29C63B